MYFLLLSRKERQPSVEDEARAPGGANQRGKQLMASFNGPNNIGLN